MEQQAVASAPSDLGDDDFGCLLDLPAELELRELVKERDLRMKNIQSYEQEYADQARKYEKIRAFKMQKLAEEAEYAAGLEAALKERDAADAEVMMLEAEVLEIKQDEERIRSLVDVMKQDRIQKRGAGLPKKRSDVQGVKAEIAAKKQAALWVERDRAKLKSRMVEAKDKKKEAEQMLQRAEANVAEIVKRADAARSKGFAMTEAQKCGYDFLKRFDEGGGWRAQAPSSDEDEANREEISGAVNPGTSEFGLGGQVGAEERPSTDSPDASGGDKKKKKKKKRAKKGGKKGRK